MCVSGGAQAPTHTLFHVGGVPWVQYLRLQLARDRVRACKAPACDSRVEREQAVMGSTEEVPSLGECAWKTQICDTMEEGKGACVHIAPSCLVKEGEQAAGDMTDAVEESKQVGEASTKKESVCSLPSEEDGTSNWADLPPDLLANIIARLSFDELLKEIPFVCKTWKLASECPLCWVKLFSDPKFAIGSTPRRIEHALRYCQGHLLEINAPRLRDRHCLNFLACSSPLLQKLYLPRSGADDEWATYAAPLLPNLKELDLSLCKTSFRALIAFGKHCMGITKVKWHNDCWGELPVDDGEALAIAQHYPNLEHLGFSGNALSAEGLCAIVDNCPALTYLDLNNCYNVVGMRTEKLFELCRARFEFSHEKNIDSVRDYDYDADDWLERHRFLLDFCSY